LDDQKFSTGNEYKKEKVQIQIAFFCSKEGGLKYYAFSINSYVFYLNILIKVGKWCISVHIIVSLVAAIHILVFYHLSSLFQI